MMYDGSFTLSAMAPDTIVVAVQAKDNWGQEKDMIL